MATVSGSTPPASGAGARPGLRERKKARTRADIQRHTLRLISQQGLGATTVEQIADAADISPSTFFRYFRNKEEAAVADFMDEAVFDAAVSAPAGLDPIQALQHGFRTVMHAMSDEDWAHERLRNQLIQTVPELQRGLMEEMARPMELSVRAVALRLGLPEDSPQARMFGCALIGGLVGLMMTTGHVEEVPIPESREEAIEMLEQGIELLRTMLIPPA